MLKRLWLLLFPFLSWNSLKRLCCCCTAYRNLLNEYVIRVIDHVVDISQHSGATVTLQRRSVVACDLPCSSCSVLPIGLNFRWINSRITCKSDSVSVSNTLNARCPLIVQYIGAERGWGLFADASVLPGQFVCEYAGEVITTDELTRRHDNSSSSNDNNNNDDNNSHSNYHDGNNNNKKSGCKQDDGVSGCEYGATHRNNNYYVLSIMEHITSADTTTKVTLRSHIDATDCGNAGRFANHSCDPNMYIRIVRVPTDCSVDGVERQVVPTVALFARKHVKSGDELTFDYSGASTSTLLSSTVCRCGADICNGFLPRHNL